jgi:Spy/CpxP family protein refolding chaperone
MKFSRAAIAAYVGLIFASGAVLGIFVERLVTVEQQNTAPHRPDPEAERKKIVGVLTDRLHLSGDQLNQLNMIMDETRSRVEETRRSMGPAYHKIHEEQNQKIRNILTPDQQTEFDKILKEREKAREERNKQNGRGIQRVQ